MPAARPCNIYREQLIPLDHGHALWEPNPVEGFYDRVTIGDVGYLSDGFFHRMFNVTLPWDDPSNRRHGVPPQRYDPLDIGPPPNVRKAILTKGYYLSQNVHSQANLNDPSAVVPSDAEGFTYKCKGHGALLSLPHDGHREDAIRRGVFEKYIRDNVVSWFEWSRNIGLGVARIEDLILVSGCALVTSWGAAVFPGHGVDASISLADHALPNGAGRFVWGNTSRVVPHHNSQLESDNSSLTTNQCVFIKGFRAKRGLLWLKRIRAAAGPLPDDPDNNPEDEIQVAGGSEDLEYRDPIIGILDYIAEKCSEDVIAIAHDDDLQTLENVEVLTADAVEQFLRQNQNPVLIDGGVAFLHDQDDDVSKLPSSKMRRQAVHEPSLIVVETISPDPPPYETHETSSSFKANAPAPPQYRDKALAVESPHHSVLASSSSRNEEPRASSSQRLEEVTTPPAQPEIERSKYQPHEFNATRRMPFSVSSVHINMEVNKPWDVYRENLTSLYHGHALWEPSPIRSIYDQVSIGDVGYVNEGVFRRMFNVTLPWNHPSNNRLGEPDHYKPLDWGPFANIREATLAKGDYYSRNVFTQDNSGNIHAREPRDAEGVTYKCKGPGALLSLPHDAYREDVVRTKSFEDYIRDNAAGWFEWSRKIGLGVERMEDLILVSGRTLVSSWAAVTFNDDAQEAQISLTVQALPNGGASFVWSNVYGTVTYHHSRFDPNNPSPLMNQCIFIRGFRSKRRLFWTIPMWAAAEPLPDDPDNHREDEIQKVSGETSMTPWFQHGDPLVGVLDYITQKCPVGTITMSPGDYFRQTENVGIFTADAVEEISRQNQTLVLTDKGATIPRDLRSDAHPVPDETRATSFVTAGSGRDPVPRLIQPISRKVSNSRSALSGAHPIGGDRTKLGLASTSGASAKWTSAGASPGAPFQGNDQFIVTTDGFGRTRSDNHGVTKQVLQPRVNGYDGAPVNATSLPAILAVS